MYAIIDDGGKQYKVEQDALVCVETRDLKADQKTIEFDRVLFYRDQDSTLVGQPIIEGAKVIGEITNLTAGTKLYPMQFRRRKNSKRRIGHRQKYLEVKITDIVKS